MDSDYWESYYARSLQRRGGSLRSEDCYCDPDSLMPLLPIHHGQGQALLVGSGTSELPQRLVEKGWKVWAMDVSPSCVAWMEKLQPKVEWCCADAFALPESWSNTFDLVLDKGLLGPKASEDPCGMALGQLLAQYRRVLQPGGHTLIVSLAPLNSFRAWPEPAVESIWEMSTHDLPGSVAYLLKLRGGALDVQTFPCWASIIDLSAESVHLRVSLTAEQRRSLQLSTDGHVARVQRPETDEVFELSLPWHVTSAKWTSQGLKLSAG
ncbi:unnamed protein product [Durusdinium trenchii]|uniref:Methyltransferase domain-containing protein n=1 Tax=Durusdinium trenchii TaxID=1381693 RepID=A0ABP0NW34_9DINO